VADGKPGGQGVSRRIAWVKWRNPLAFGARPDAGDDDVVESEWDYDRDEPWDEDAPDGDAYEGRVLAGPMGVFPLGSFNDPGVTYKLWVGHTNFWVGADDRRAIRETPGVELLRVWTPYRFWLGVGSLFRADDVKGAVEGRLCPKPAPHGRSLAVSVLKRRLASCKAWAILADPEGKLVALRGDDPAKVMTQVGHHPDCRLIDANWRTRGDDRRTDPQV
jgi:hypothetical protein